MSELIYFGWCIAEVCYLITGWSVPAFGLVLLVALLKLAFQSITWGDYRRLAVGYSKWTSIAAFAVIVAGLFELSTVSFVRHGPDTAMAAGNVSAAVPPIDAPLITTLLIRKRLRSSSMICNVSASAAGPIQDIFAR